MVFELEFNLKLVKLVFLTLCFHLYIVLYYVIDVLLIFLYDVLLKKKKKKRKR